MSSLKAVNFPPDKSRELSVFFVTFLHGIFFAVKIKVPEVLHFHTGFQKPAVML